MRECGYVALFSFLFLMNFSLYCFPKIWHFYYCILNKIIWIFQRSFAKWFLFTLLFVFSWKRIIYFLWRYFTNFHVNNRNKWNQQKFFMYVTLHVYRFGKTRLSIKTSIIYNRRRVTFLHAAPKPQNSIFQLSIWTSVVIISLSLKTFVIHKILRNIFQKFETFNSFSKQYISLSYINAIY